MGQEPATDSTNNAPDVLEANGATTGGKETAPVVVADSAGVEMAPTTDAPTSPANDADQQNEAPDATTFSADYVKKLRDEAAKRRVEAKTLEEQVDQLRGTVDAMLKQVSDANEARIEAIPDAMKGLVPEFDDPLRLQQWLDRNAGILSKPSAPTLNGGTGRQQRPGSGVTLTERQREAAARAGISEEAFATALAKQKQN